jgi:NADH dehydrogenase
VDRGSLAMIGQHAAVVDLGFIKLRGFFAWFVWLFIHIYFLIEFDNKLVVMIQWLWSYFTRNRGARLITGKETIPPVPIVNSDSYTPIVTKKPLNV